MTLKNAAHNIRKLWVALGQLKGIDRDEQNGATPPMTVYNDKDHALEIVSSLGDVKLNDPHIRQN